MTAQAFLGYVSVEDTYFLLRDTLTPAIVPFPAFRFPAFHLARSFLIFALGLVIHSLNLFQLLNPPLLRASISYASSPSFTIQEKVEDELCSSVPPLPLPTEGDMWGSGHRG